MYVHVCMYMYIHPCTASVSMLRNITCVYMDIYMNTLKQSLLEVSFFFFSSFVLPYYLALSVGVL